MVQQSLESRVSVLEANRDALKADIEEIKNDIRGIFNRLNRGYRPPWSVTILITFLTSLSVGLLVSMFK